MLVCINSLRTRYCVRINYAYALYRHDDAHMSSIYALLNRTYDITYYAKKVRPYLVMSCAVIKIYPPLRRFDVHTCISKA